MNPMRIGRSIIAYNSLFVALIRYIYIVYHQKANQWSFEKVGRLFQIASIVVPVMVEVIRIFSEKDLPGLKTTERFRKCVASNEGLNSTDNLVLPDPAPVAFSLQYLPSQVVNAMYYMYLTSATLVWLNIIEGYFYLKMYHIVKT